MLRTRPLNRIAGMGVLAGLPLIVASAAHAQLVPLFSTYDDFNQSGWALGGPASSLAATTTEDYDGGTVDGAGNLTSPGAPGTAGSLMVNFGSNPIGYTYTVFSPNELNNSAFMSLFDPGSSGGNTVAYKGTLYYTYSTPSFVGPDDYYQVGIDLSYPGDGYYGQYFETKTVDDGIIDGIDWTTATIPYTINAGSGGGFTISPSWNAGVYGSGVGGVSNVLTGPVYYDAFDVNAVPEPTTLSLLGIGSLLALRRRR